MPEVFDILLKRVDTSEGRLRSYEWEAPTGRTFAIEEEENSDGSSVFYVEEFKPNGSLLLGKDERGNFKIDGHSELSRSLQAMIKDDAVPPSAVYQEMERHSITRENIISMGVGMGRFSTLKEARAAIYEAYSSDQWGCKPEQHPREITKDEMRKDIESSIRYWQWEVDKLEASSDTALFQGMSGILNGFSKESQKKLLAFLNTPTSKTWDDAHCLMLLGGHTAWQLWCKYDDEAPRSKPEGEPWSSFPSSDQFIEIIDRARVDVLQECKNRLSEKQQLLADLIKDDENQHDPLAEHNSKGSVLQFPTQR